MNKDERNIKIEELLELKNELLKNSLNDDNNSNNKESSKMLVKSNGKSVLPNEMIDNRIDYIDTKSGMVNVVLLSLITFIFEVLFISISIVLFK